MAVGIGDPALTHGGVASKTTRGEHHTASGKKFRMFSVIFSEYAYNGSFTDDEFATRRRKNDIHLELAQRAHHARHHRSSKNQPCTSSEPHSLRRVSNQKPRDVSKRAKGIEAIQEVRNIRSCDGKSSEEKRFGAWRMDEMKVRTQFPSINFLA